MILHGQKLRILCVIETLGRGGGAEQLVYSLAPALRAIKVEIEFVDLFSWVDDLGKELEEMGFKVHRLDVSSQWNLLSVLPKLVRVIRSGNFDLVWGHLYFGNLYTQLSKFFLLGSIPTIATLHSEGYSEKPPIYVRSKLRVWIERIIVGSVNTQVAVSNAVANDYARYFSWRRISVVYNGVPTKQIPDTITETRKQEVRERYCLDSNDFVIVVPSRLVEKKGHIYLLKAINILRNEYQLVPKVIFLGSEGEQLPVLSSFISQHSLTKQVQIIPPIKHPELFHLFLSADVIVLPSLREPFGIAAAEAMTTGTPVVLTEVDGFLELVGDSECAFMVNPGNEIALVDALLRVMSDRGSAKVVGSKGRMRMLNNFDIDVCAAAWRDIFTKTIKMQGEIQ